MTQLTVPTSLDGITTSWLSTALQNLWGPGEIQVARVESETIAVGEGFAGGLGRLTIEYSPGSTPGPKTLIAKMPSAHLPTRKLLTTLGVYEREVRFYQNAASEISMRTPKCFLANWDSESYGFILLLEDLAALRSQDQIIGCPVDDAELVVTELAKFHAPLWNNPMLEDWDWAPRWDAGASLFGNMYPMWMRQLQEKFPGAISDDFRRTANLIEPHVASIKTRLAQGPVTLCHGDYRLDNMFFDDTNSGNSLVVFDWQALRVGRAPYDLAYFLGTSMAADDRLAHQQRLKSLYFETLVQSGVADYSEGDFDEDFDYALLDLVSFTALIGANLNFDNERGRQFAEVYMGRVADTLSEIDTERLIANLQ
ncbi:MAG: phosphotransferase [Chloroflexi bacterium]|nr:phosphotransferase [Chloroflexota bacterium]